ncbi:MAG: polysaccharide biosynthesis protein [Candidatus Parcubacteria bacterium]|nr:polysaccharide biosynthesis protein [Candidatus Parcubacteria bacterium]
MKIIKLIARDIRDLFVRLLPDRSDPKEYNFAFIVHPRNMRDVLEKYPFLKIFPEKVVEFFLRHHWPMVVTDIRGLQSRIDGAPVRGWMIAVPLTGKQMLEDKDSARKKVLQAVALAEKMGAKIVGLGAFTSSVTEGGKDVIGKTKISVTSGNTLTATIAVGDIETYLAKAGSAIKTIAVIGATGSIGSAIAKEIATNTKHSVNRLILMSRTLANIETLEKEIEALPEKIKMEIIGTNDITKVWEADMVVVTTSAEGAVMKSEFLKEGVVIYDLTQPKNTPKELLEKRKDIIFMDGGLISAPQITYKFNIGLPEGALFSCLTETMILAGERTKNGGFVGKVDYKNIPKMSELAQSYGFHSHAK